MIFFKMLYLHGFLQSPLVKEFQIHYRYIGNWE